MRFSSSRMKERLGDPACTLPARRQGAKRGTLQRWPACEMTTTSPGLRSEEREEHEELRRPSPRGRPRLIRPPLTHQAATGKGAPRGNAHLSENE